MENLVSLNWQNWPEPIANPQLLGHLAQEQQLRAAFDSGRMPHAWIFTGPKGVGKATLAHRLARYILAQNEQPAAPATTNSLFGDEPAATPAIVDDGTLFVSPDHAVFQRIKAGGHNDLTILSPDNENTTRKTRIIAVDDVRKIIPSQRFTAANDGWRIIIIDGGETMNRNAQNALLKLLEEPKPNTLILITADNCGALLPTIRSRCRILSLTPPALDDYSQHLAPDLSPDDLSILAYLSHNAPGAAIACLQQDAIAHYRHAINLLSAADAVAAHAMADKYGRGSDNGAFECFGDCLVRILQGLALTAVQSQQTMPLYSALQPIWGRVPVSVLLPLHQTLAELWQTTIASALDRKQTFLLAQNHLQKALQF